MPKRLLKSGQHYTSINDGAFMVLHDHGWNNVDIEFPSGYRGSVCRQQIKKGNVKDYFKPTYFGVGFHGGGGYKTKQNGKNTTAYNRWKHMIARCYNKDNHNYNAYGGRGVTVCDSWHNFQNYAEWFYKNQLQGCDVDKDILSGDVKIYSPSTCKFVTHQRNSEVATAKTYQFTNPDGINVEVYNLKEFCDKNSLTRANMLKVLNGERAHHKGWTC